MLARLDVSAPWKVNGGFWIRNIEILVKTISAWIERSWQFAVSHLCIDLHIETEEHQFRELLKVLRSSDLKRSVFPIMIQVFLHISVDLFYLLPTIDVAIIIWWTGLKWIACLFLLITECRRLYTCVDTRTFVLWSYPTPARLDVSLFPPRNIPSPDEGGWGSNHNRKVVCADTYPAAVLNTMSASSWLQEYHIYDQWAWRVHREQNIENRLVKLVCEYRRGWMSSAVNVKG